MVEIRKSRNARIRGWLSKAAKAVIKGLIIYVIYFFAWMILSPVAEILPGLQQIIETFVIVYIIFAIIGSVTAGTIYEHFFNVGKALFVILYIIISLNGGVVSLTFEQLALTIDLRFFLVVMTSLSLFGLAKAMVQAIDFLNKKAEFAAATIAEMP